MDMLLASECSRIKDLRDSLSRLPAGINSMYEATMKRVESHPNAALARLALTWVVFSEQPLSVDEMRYAVAVDPQTYRFDIDCLVDHDTILSWCCSLMVVESHSE